MTDPERISRRASGLAAELLRAGADEQPSGAGLQRTLLAGGAAGAVLTSASAAGAAAGAARAVSTATAAGGAKAVKAVSAALLVKWIGVGVVGGVGLAGAAAVMSGPAAPAASAPLATVAAPRAPAPRVLTPVTEPQVVAPAAPEAPETEAAPVVPSQPGSEASPPAPAVDVGAPLAAEVAFVDHARALLASGQSAEGLAQLRSYELKFPEARLLPEVLFLELETCDRIGRKAEARAAAQRLVEGFPKSPHATRARKLLFP